MTGARSAPGEAKYLVAEKQGGSRAPKNRLEDIGEQPGQRYSGKDITRAPCELPPLRQETPDQNEPQRDQIDSTFAELRNNRKDAMDRRIERVTVARQRLVEPPIGIKEQRERNEAEPGKILQRARWRAQRVEKIPEAVMDDDGTMKQPAYAIDEEARGDHIGEKMAALREADEAERRAQR